MQGSDGCETQIQKCWYETAGEQFPSKIQDYVFWVAKDIFQDHYLPKSELPLILIPAFDLFLKTQLQCR